MIDTRVTQVRRPRALRGGGLYSTNRSDQRGLGRGSLAGGRRRGVEGGKVRSLASSF